MKIREMIESDIPDLAKVSVDTWRTTYTGIIPAETLANMSYEKGIERRRKTLSEKLAGTKEWHTFVAEDENGKVFGFVDGGPQRKTNADFFPEYKGELYAMYVLKAQQQKGAGRQLVKALAARLLERGMNSMVVHVLSKNPSRKFYEKMGGNFIKTSNIEIGGAKLEEAIYGWKNLREILEK